MHCKHVVSRWGSLVVDMAMYGEALICFTRLCPTPFGAPFGGSKILGLMITKASDKCAKCNLDSGGPILAPRSLFSVGFV